MRSSMRKKRERNRFINKYGDYNISHRNVPAQYRMAARDLFNTMVNLKWRWTTLVFFTMFTLCWLFFSIIFFVNMVIHKDFEEHIQSENFRPCLMNVDSFVEVFLFSFESQTTIGFGARYTTDACPLVWILTCVQNLIGSMLQGMLIGIIFTKLARPKKRAHTIIFSDTATIAMRDGKLCFLFRVGDLRKTQLIEAHIRVQMIRSRVTAEGEHIPYNQYEMNVGYDEGKDRLFMLFPATVCHVIDEHSPLYGLGPSDLNDPLHNRFEIVVILEGSVEAIGSTVQCMHSYVASEIVWGQRFDTLVCEESVSKGHLIDFSLFHNTSPTPTPMYSGKQIDEMKEEGLDIPRMHQVELPMTPETPCDTENMMERMSTSTQYDQLSNETTSPSPTQKANEYVSLSPMSINKDSELIINSKGLQSLALDLKENTHM